MKGSILSRWSRRARLLQPTAMMFALLFVLQSCAGKGGQATDAPEPKSEPKPETPAPKQVADAKPAKDAKPAEPAKPAAPTPAAPPAPPPVPAVTDSAAVATALCKQITDGVRAAIKADSAPTDVNAVARKVTGSIADSSAKIAFAKGTTCR